MPIFRPDWRFVEIEHELWALSQFLPWVEQQIAYLRAQDRIRTEAELVEQGYKWEDGDTQVAFQQIYDRAERIFPRFMRGPFILSLWACFESSVMEVGDYLAREQHRELRLREVRGKDFVDGAVRYYSTVLGVPLDRDTLRLDRIRDLLRVRNAFAHGNGQQRAVPPDKWAALEQAIQRNPEIVVTDGVLVLSAHFLRTAWADVDESVRELVLRVRGGPAVVVEGA